MKDDLLKFKLINCLKNVYRAGSVDDRNESSAEHSWSCLLLADFFLQKMNLNIDKLKVYELLMYHDLVEIESGDTHPQSKVSEEKQCEQELKGAKILRDSLPKEFGKKYWSLFNEFEELETLESKFARAVDKFDAVIQEIDYKEDWKCWTREGLYNMKAKYFKDFPEIINAFNQLLDYLEQEGYFNQ